MFMNYMVRGLVCQINYSLCFHHAIPSICQFFFISCGWLKFEIVKGMLFILKVCFALRIHLNWVPSLFTRWFVHIHSAIPCEEEKTYFVDAHLFSCIFERRLNIECFLMKINPTKNYNQRWLIFLILYVCKTILLLLIAHFTQ